jgi:cytochrome c oxidase assembly protein subunit 15
MIHRYAAGTLGLLIVVLFFLKARYSKILLGLVIFQAALGMWTVTLRLQPIIVMAHLLGGFVTLGLLFLSIHPLPNPPPRSGRGDKEYTHLLVEVGIKNKHNRRKLQPWLGIALVCLILQLLLGGWTSANYAALICPDFPTCQGVWWPTFSWQSVNPFTGWGLTNPLTAVSAPMQQNMHMLHRLGALITTLAFGGLIIRLYQKRQIKWMLGIGGLLLFQIALGLSNVFFKLPLWVAVAHNGVGALLFLTLLALFHA